MKITEEKLNFLGWSKAPGMWEKNAKVGYLRMMPIEVLNSKWRLTINNGTKILFSFFISEIEHIEKAEKLVLSVTKEDCSIPTLCYEDLEKLGLKRDLNSRKLSWETVIDSVTIKLTATGLDVWTIEFHSPEYSQTAGIRTMKDLNLALDFFLSVEGLIKIEEI